MLDLIIESVVILPGGEPMIAEQASEKLGSPVVLHLGIALTAGVCPNPAVASNEEYESLWVRVNRICDKYVPERKQPGQVITSFV